MTATDTLNLVESDVEAILAEGEAGGPQGSCWAKVNGKDYLPSILQNLANVGPHAS